MSIGVRDSGYAVRMHTHDSLRNEASSERTSCGREASDEGCRVGITIAGARELLRGDVWGVGTGKWHRR